MSVIGAIHWKQNHAPGLRGFQSSFAAEQAGENPASLVSAGGVLIKWPGALGAPPDDATVATWVAEYDADIAAQTNRREAVKADAEADTFVDKLRSATPAQITQFVQTNVTDLASAKTFLAKLGIAVAYALQGGRDK